MGSNQSRPAHADKRSSPQNAYKRNNKRGASDQAASNDQQKTASEPSQPDLLGCTTRHGTKDPMANPSFNDTTSPHSTTARERTGHSKRVKRRATCSPPPPASLVARSHSRSTTCDSGYSSGLPGSSSSGHSSSSITTGTDELSSISWYSPHCAPEGVEEEGEDEINHSSPTNLPAILALANNAPSSPPPYPEQQQQQTPRGSGSSSPSSSYASILDRLRQAPQDTYEILCDVFERARVLDDPEDKKQAFQAAVTWSQQQHEDDEDDEVSNAAAVWVAQCYLEGCGVAQDSALGFAQLRALADRGCWQAFLPLAMCYLNGVDPAIAYQWLSTAAQLDIDSVRGSKKIVALAQLRLGMMLSEDSCADEVLAFHWFQKSASLGNCQAQFIVGTHYELGLQVDKDIEHAKEYLLASAVQDFAPAQAAIGIRLVDEGAFDDGIHWLERAVQSDNPRALVKLATMYEDGHGVEQNNELAAFYYKAAANRGYPSAQYRLALRYHFGGLGLEPNHQEADRYLLQAAYAGYPAAQRLLGLTFLEDFAAPVGYDRRRNARRNRNNVTALEWFRKAAAQGDPRAYVLVGSCYEQGRGVATDYETALEYYTKAAQIQCSFQGSAQLAVAQLLLHRMNREADAFEWFVRAAASPCSGGHSGFSRHLVLPASKRQCAAHRAKLMVARYYLHGWPGAKRDRKRAFDQLMQLSTESADDGHVFYWLGACYEEGLPGICNCNPQKAFEYYKMAADLDHTDGQFQVGYMLSNGIGVACDRAAAFVYYENAARKRHKTALFSLGLYYYKGVANVSKDLSKARKCFEEAARLGVPEAMESLASLCMLQASRPVSSLTRQRLERQQQDRERAIYWFRKAASLGNAAAQRELGKLHDVGQGVPQDYNTAFELFKQAASKKDAVATLLLGSYYQNGHAVEKDLDKALRLYLEAAKLGSPIAPFAAGQLYHSINQFENAYMQYKIAASDARLANNRIGKTSKLMVARYILSYIPAMPESGSGDHPVNCLGNATKQEAFNILLRLAENDGFAPAFYWLADCYRQGNGCTVDLKQAATWMKRVADETNDAEAMIKLASMFDEGIGVSADKAKAVHYYKQAADLGHAEAQYQLGLAYWRGLYNVDVNVNEAVRWFTASAQQKFCESYWALGQMAMENNDQDVALAWWNKAVELGHVASMSALGKLFLELAAKDDDQDHVQHSPPRDVCLSKALALLTNAARLGDAEAFFILGHLHQAGTVTAASRYKSFLSCPLLDMTNTTAADENDPAELLLQRQQEELELATRCYQQAAEMGHMEAMYFAAQLWHSQQQYAAALEFYAQAAAKGHLLARVMAARYQLVGLGGIPADPPKAYQILLECAENDLCADAYNTLGQCHEEGLGTDQSDTKALEWYLRSAEDTKDAEAMFRIGLMYASGRVPCHGKHPVLEAINWFEFACSACNHAEANYRLGLFYLYGYTDEELVVVPQDTNAAQYHFEQASAQDHQGAMFELAQLLLSNNDEYTLEDQQYGFEVMDRAAQLGSREAQLELGKLYHSGKEHQGSGVIVVPQDHEKAYDLFCRAAYQKDKMATLFVAFYHENGIHVPPNFEFAREMYQAAVDLGKKDDDGGWWLAELALATLLHQKPEMRADAYRLFQAAREHQSDPTNVTADIMCAQYKLYGWGGVQPCPEEAFATLIHHAKANNDVRAIIQVARCYEQGHGVTRDLKLAQMWYERLVDLCDDDNDNDDAASEQIQQDLAEALYKLAEFYHRGVAGRKHTVKAFTLYKHAAEKGCKEAQHRLISICHNSSSNDKQV